MVSNKVGILYTVATPIGNLSDLGRRAIEVLGQVDLIAAEDTRHSKKLLSHYGINRPLVSCHEHNESQQASKFIGLLQQGQSIALISDAGTPLISDPGYRVVNAAIDEGIRVVPVPGPCAAIAALSASGLATDRFLFAGFLSAKAGACREQFEKLARETATLVFYESPRRLRASLKIALSVLGADRQTVVARELTKIHEIFARGRLEDVMNVVGGDDNWQKGELVLMFAGAANNPAEMESDLDVLGVLKPLLDELPLKQAVSLATTITGARKNQVYDLAIELQKTR